MICNGTVLIIWVCLWCGIESSRNIYGKLKHFLWSRVGGHYGTEKKYENCLGKLCFKEQLKADSFSGWAYIHSAKSHKSRR